MSQKPISSQISRPKIIFLGFGLITSVAIAFTAPSIQTEQQTVSARIAPANFAVTGLVLAHGAGAATVRLDQFNVSVSFDYRTFKDSYSTQGSEFTAIEIDSLGVDSITDDHGNDYIDFTSSDDIVNIKNLIVAYVYKNKVGV